MLNGNNLSEIKQRKAGLCNDYCQMGVGVGMVVVVIDIVLGGG